jgi:hypothetical protein
MASAFRSNKEVISNMLKEASDNSYFLFKKLPSRHKTQNYPSAQEKAFLKNRQFLRNQNDGFYYTNPRSFYPYPRSLNSPAPLDNTDIELLDATNSHNTYGNLSPEELLKRISGKNQEYTTTPFPLQLNLKSSKSSKSSKSFKKLHRPVSKSPRLKIPGSNYLSPANSEVMLKPISLQNTRIRRFEDFSEVRRNSSTNSSSKFMSPSRLAEISIKVADDIFSSCNQIISETCLLKLKISKGGDTIKNSYKACKNYTKMINDSNKRVEFFMLRQKILRKKSKLLKRLL